MAAPVPTHEDMLYLRSWYHAGCPSVAVRNGAYTGGLLHPSEAVRILGELLKAWDEQQLLNLEKWPTDRDVVDGRG